jgi:hypothetical protein
VDAIVYVGAIPNFRSSKGYPERSRMNFQGQRYLSDPAGLLVEVFDTEISNGSVNLFGIPRLQNRLCVLGLTI